MYYNNLKNYMGDYNIIVVNNKDIGVFAVDESCYGESYISEISLIEEYQNKGIGTDILNKLLTKNKEKGLKTKLKVFKNSPAKRLYERLGFSIYGENESHYQMEIKGDT
jgi:ribosomal protein S18 acetylase RimI-like enzyme